jgi:RNA polymerase sigma factor (sigma-70 family)
MFSRGKDEGDLDWPTQVSLFAQAQAGCGLSLDRLMHRHDGLVRAVVRQQFLGPLSFAEALQAGRIGLWHAILGFDVHRGVAFSTYAYPAILHEVWRAVKSALRFSTPLAVPGASPSPSPDPAALSEAALALQALQELLQRLPPRLERIVVAYYGLGDQPPASYRCLGARLGLSHERVRQLHRAALVWLRHPAHSYALRTLLNRHTLADYEHADALAQRWLQQRAGRHGR